MNARLIQLDGLVSQDIMILDEIHVRVTRNARGAQTVGMHTRAFIRGGKDVMSTVALRTRLVELSASKLMLNYTDTVLRRSTMD